MSISVSKVKVLAGQQISVSTGYKVKVRIGVPGPQGPEGLSEITTDTDTTISGILKGAAGKAAQAVAGTDYVATNDARLSDARTPTAHTHTLSAITDAGGAAGLNVGTSAGTVAAGDDSRFDNPWLSATLAEDFSVTSSIVPAAVSGLSSIQLEAATNYEIAGFFHFSASGGGGRGRLILPSQIIPAQSGVTVFAPLASIITQPTFTVISAPKATSEEFTFGASTTTGRACRIHGVIQTGTTAGALEFLFAQQSSNASASLLKAGSWIRVKKINV
jgi:hypothetical protein